MIERRCCGTLEGTPHRSTCRPYMLKEIDRLTAQLARTEKALKDTIRIHLVDDDEWDVEEKTMKIFTRIMKEVE